MVGPWLALFQEKKEIRPWLALFQSAGTRIETLAVGKICGLEGVDAAFEAPNHVELRVQTSTDSGRSALKHPL